MLINYSIDDIRAFCVATRAGQFTLAAELLSITPSALSRRVANIEESVGGRVFDRSTRRLRLTPLGTVLYERLAPLLTQLDGGIADVARMARGEAGGIGVAMVATVAYSALPTALDQFYAAFPSAFVSIRDGIANSIAMLVEQRQVEFGISTHMAFGSALEAARLGSYGFNLVGSRQDPRLASDELEWASLQSMKMVSLHPLSSTRLQVDGELASHGMGVPWCMEVDQLSTLIGLIRDGQYMAILPSLFHAEAHSLKSVSMVRPLIRRDLFLIRRRDVTLSAQGEQLAKFIVAAIGKTPGFEP